MKRAILVLLLLGGLGAGYVVFSLNAPYSGFQQATFVDIPKGTSTPEMARLLANAGVIQQTWTFLTARVVRRGVTLQAGEYRFTHPASVLEVLDRIARGDIFYYELVVPEGKDMFDIAAATAQLGLFPAAQFLQAARNPALIHDLDPEAPTLEGYLFPDTYRLTRHMTPDAVCRLMTSQFRQAWQHLGAADSVHRIVTLASLVEKEGKLPEERPMIASVFLRRLSIGMKLDCDPSTIYAAKLAGTYRGTIYRSDLESGNPYNTYRHAGLPPGPIANPGVASMQAVLHPAEADYLYFVLRPDSSGGHTFSSNLEAHQAAIVRYRQSLHR